MKLSPRLKAIASMVSSGSKVADIGTDHAYIPIYLVKSEIIPFAIAMDINDGPLEIAKENIREARCLDVIDIRKSDGIKSLVSGEVDSVVIAGMGGNLIKSILLGNMQVLRSLKECIIQPQSEMKMLRSFLVNNGFVFVKEDAVKDDGKYYFIMKVVLGREREKESNKWSQEELSFGKILLRNKNEVLKEYLMQEKHVRDIILANLEYELIKLANFNYSNVSDYEYVECTNKIDKISKRKAELHLELDTIKGGLSFYDM